MVVKKSSVGRLPKADLFVEKQKVALATEYQLFPAVEHDLCPVDPEHWKLIPVIRKGEAQLACNWCKHQSNIPKHMTDDTLARTKMDLLGHVSEEKLVGIFGEDPKAKQRARAIIWLLAQSIKC